MKQNGKKLLKFIGINLLIILVMLIFGGSSAFLIGSIQGCAGGFMNNYGENTALFIALFFTIYGIYNAYRKYYENAYINPALMIAIMIVSYMVITILVLAIGEILQIGGSQICGQDL